MKNKYFLIFAVMIWAVSGIGCNMVKGTGQDVESAGKSIQSAADSKK